MRRLVRPLHPLAAIALIAALAPAPVSAQSAPVADANDPFAIFTPTRDPIRHRIDYEIYDFALKNIVVTMGPSTRSLPYAENKVLGTRLRQGHNSIYRLEGSMVGFSFLDEAAIAGFAEYRRDLERVGDSLVISSLPRNEQLAYWLNLHNVALLEVISREWPVRQPRELEIDGMPLDEAKFIIVSGVSMSLRDIRERIVYANWRDPKVIYGFWRGEIGGPALEREAFTGSNVSSLLDRAAEGFVNSLRGTEKSGSRLDVSRLYDEVASYYFPDFEADLRAHMSDYANEEVMAILGNTDSIRAAIREHDIADLSGGSRGANYLGSSRPGVTHGMMALLAQRQRKLDNIERRQDIRRGQVIFSNIDLPGDPPNKNAVQ